MCMITIVHQAHQGTSPSPTAAHRWEQLHTGAEHTIIMIEITRWAMYMGMQLHDRNWVHPIARP